MSGTFRMLARATLKLIPNGLRPCINYCCRNHDMGGLSVHKYDEREKRGGVVPFTRNHKTSI